MKHLLWKILRGGFFVFICLVTLLALVIAEENWRGKRDWEAYKREAVARGERIDFASIIPPPVPDEQNMAMTPVFKQLFDAANQPGAKTAENGLSKLLALEHSGDNTKQPLPGDWKSGEHIDLAAWGEYLGGPDILQALKKFDPEMDEISKAARLPYARFPLQYEDTFSMKMPHLQPLRWLAKLFSIRAQAALAAGQTEAALQDVQTIFRLANAVQGEPPIVSQLVAFLMRHHGEQAVWEGMSGHQWSESQLAALQLDFQKTDALTTEIRSLKGERIVLSDTIDNLPREQHGLVVMLSSAGVGWSEFLSRLLPRGFFYQNVLSINRHYEQYIDPAISLTERRIFPKMAQASDQQMSRPRSILHPQPYTVFLTMTTPALTRCLSRYAAAQSAADEGAIACALERYWLAQGNYPDTLEALAPTYFQKLPHDVIGGEPLKYRREGEGFRLYSIGWNEQDDGGKVAKKHAGGAELENGDWVWALPGK